MAEVPVDKVKDQLRCSVCLEIYKDPKILTCFHIFCQQCLEKIYQKQAIPGYLPCPNCRQVTPVSGNKTANLQPAFHINSLLEIVHQHKTQPTCPSAGEVVPYQRNFDDPPASSMIFCSEHGARMAELYCETCKKMICLKCVIRGAQHNSHDYNDIDESFRAYEKVIMPLLEPMEKKMLAVNAVLAELSDLHEKVVFEQKAIKSDIQEKSKQMHTLIDQREKALVSELIEVIEMKLKGLSLQKQEAVILQAQLSSCLEFTRLKLDSGNSKVIKSEAVAMKTDLLKQIKKVLDMPEPKCHTPSVETSAVFSVKEDVPETISSFGKVNGTSPDPLKCTIAGNGSVQALVNETATAILTAVNFRNEPCILPITFEAELVSELTGKKMVANVEPIAQDDRDRSEYAITYQPTSKGRHHLHIKADGQHITGSPFSIAVKMPVESLGSPLHALNDIAEPWGITMNSKGEMVVTEWGNSSVSILSPMGKKLWSFKSHGLGEGRLCSVAIDSEGSMFVTCANHSIQKFTSDGSFSKSVGTHGGKEMLEFNCPYGITYNSYNRKIYVADSNNHRIQVLNTDLNFSKMFGKKGNGKGQFDHPQGIATDNTGKVYIADTGNHRIQVFTENGNFMTSFGKKGAGRGKLDLPRDVAVDENGLVYVSEFRNDRVSVFSPEGDFKVSFGVKGAGQGQFNGPLGLAVDNSRVVYVCDSVNNRVQLF